MGMRVLTISAVDVDGINATVFRDVKLRNNGKAIAKRGAVAESKESKDDDNISPSSPPIIVNGACDSIPSKTNNIRNAKDSLKPNHPKMDRVLKAIAKRGAKKSKQRAGASLFRDVREPAEFVFDVPSAMVMAADDGKENEDDGGTGLVAEIEFFGNYSEPNLCVPLLQLMQDGPYSINKRPKEDLSPMARPKRNDGEFVCRLVMDIGTRQWTIEQGVSAEDDAVEDSVEEATNTLQSMDLVAADNDVADNQSNNAEK